MAKEKEAQRVRRPAAERLAEHQAKARILEAMVKAGDNPNTQALLRGARTLLTVKPVGKKEADAALLTAQKAVQALLASLGF